MSETAQPTFRLSSRKFEHVGIMAAVGGFAAIGVTCVVLAMQQPAHPSWQDGSGQSSAWKLPAANATAPDLVIQTAPAKPQTAEVMDAPVAPTPDVSLYPQFAAFLRDVDAGRDRLETVPKPDRKPAPPPNEALPSWLTTPGSANIKLAPIDARATTLRRQHRASRRHLWAHHQEGRGEAARLMAQELRQIKGIGD